MGKRKRSLKRVYYRNFVAMIVIPILLIFFIAICIVNTMIRNAAVSNIESAQQSMLDLLESEVNDASIQLSHLAYNEDFLGTAGETDDDNTSARNTKISELENQFQFAVPPKADIISMKIYMKDGKTTYLKDDIKLSEEEVKSSLWYTQALKKKNTVSIGTYDTSLMPLAYKRQRRWEFIITAALAPNRLLDRSGRLEVAAIFYKSDIGDLINEYESKALVGITMILDENNEIIYEGRDGDSGSWYLNQLKDCEPGVMRQRMECYQHEGKANYTFVVSELSSTGWKVINLIPTSDLTHRFIRIALLMFLVLIGLFILFYLFSRYFLKNILTPVHHIVEGMLEVQESNLDVNLKAEGQYEIQQMIDSFNRMVKMLKSSIEENELAQEKRHEAEIQALQSQINPHFLVNTLNSIRFMAQVSQFDGIRKMAESLMRIVTCSFRSNISFYSLREELEVLDSYIFLMKIRYSDGFDAEYDIEERCLGFQVPRLILQPLVENSIVHGFTEENVGHLKITAKQDEDMLFLSVWDDGCGMTQETIDEILHGKKRRNNDNTSIGVENVITRMKLNFGEKCRVDIQSMYGEYSEIVLRLPIVEENHEESSDC